MTALVTGGTGFVGPRLLRMLDRPTVLSRDPDRARRSIGHLAGRIVRIAQTGEVVLKNALDGGTQGRCRNLTCRFLGGQDRHWAVTRSTDNTRFR